MLRPYLDRVVLTFRRGRHHNSPRLVGLEVIAKPPLAGRLFTEAECQAAVDVYNRNRPEDKRRWWADPNNSRRVRESLRRFWDQNAAAREQHSATMKEAASPEVCQGRSDRLRQRWADPDQRQRVTKALRRAWDRRQLGVSACPGSTHGDTTELKLSKGDQSR
jgi:hypothetical protein